MIGIFVDADACPVKDEIYVVATRYGVPVVLVANAPMLRSRWAWASSSWSSAATPTPRTTGSRDNVRPGDVVITADVPLAARCLAAGARALGTSGREFDADSIGGALAMRDLLAQRREAGEITRGPAPISAKDRSRFLGALDRIVQRSLRDRA